MFVYVIINTLHSRPSGNKTTNSASKRDGKATSNCKTKSALQAIKEDFQDFQRHSQKHRDNEQERSIRTNFLMVLMFLMNITNSIGKFVE